MKSNNSMFNFYHKIIPINLLSFFWKQFPLNIYLLFTRWSPDCHVKGPKTWDSIDKNTKVKCQVCFCF